MDEIDYQNEHNFCDICKAPLPAPNDDKGQEDWFDVLIDHFVYHECVGEESAILAFLAETDPDGDLIKAYNQCHW